MIPNRSKFHLFRFVFWFSFARSLKGCVFREPRSKKTSGSEQKHKRPYTENDSYSNLFVFPHTYRTRERRKVPLLFSSYTENINMSSSSLLAGFQASALSARSSAVRVCLFFSLPLSFFFILFHLVLSRGYFLRLNARGFYAFERGRCVRARGLTSLLRGGRWEGGNALNSRECARSRAVALAFANFTRISINDLEECSTDFSCF